MRARMYPHTATLWMARGEKDKRMQWERRTLEGVHWEGSRAMSAGANGNIGQDSFSLLVPGTLDCELCKEDFVLEGVHGDEKPHPDAIRINAVLPIYRGATLDHWEVSG